MSDNTLIVFTSDHGDMLGERGLWFKMNFFEGSARVPLMIAAPQLKPGLVEQAVSTLDVLPTLSDLAGINLHGIVPWTDGVSLIDVVSGASSRGAVPMEYAAEGTVAPMVSLREGDWKLNFCKVDPPQLFNLASDPDELENLATSTKHKDVLERLVDAAEKRWDLELYDSGASQSGAAPCGLSRSSQRRLLSLGLPTSTEGIRTLYAQSYGFECS